MTPTININSLVLFLAAGQGLLFSILLYFRGHKSRAINIHLSIILIALCGETFQQFLLDTNYIYEIPTLVGFSLPLDALIGIALYWYVRQATCPAQNNSTKQILKHYSLFFACVVLSIPYWLMNFDVKLALMENGVISSDWPAIAFYSMSLQIFLKISSFCIYLFISIKMLLEHKNRIKDIFSFKERITLVWLTNMLWLFLFGLIQGISTILFFQASDEVTSVMGFMGYFYIITIFYIGVMGLMQPRIYKRSERSYIKELQQDIQLKKEQVKTRTKYVKSALSEEDMQRIAKKLDELMKSELLYLKPDLSMPQLADKLSSVSPNYLSQTLNSVYQLSFFDYINKQRIDYAKLQLLDPELQNKSVIDIAVDSAFNSRSAFYSAFKKHVRMTPVQFKKTYKATP